jgi:phosphoenolpyruvate synthase/pyruvate phosphate dikinase
VALPADGVGLARMEFIIGNLIKIHPMALVRFDELRTRRRAEIEALTRAYATRPSTSSTRWRAASRASPPRTIPSR